MKRQFHPLMLAITFAAVLTLAATTGLANEAEAGDGKDKAADRPHNTLTEKEQKAGWRLLFDGETAEQWRGFHREDLPEGWQVVDGTLARVARGGDIITREKFEHFDLKIDWKIAPRGNSGIFFRVVEQHEGRRFGAVWHVGPEYQILCDARRGDRPPGKTHAGANYDLHAPKHDVVRPTGEWNQARLVVHGDRVEHYLNGKKIVSYEIGSEEWEQLVAGTKFRNHPFYGRIPVGHIALQDHGSGVWFRNIRIRELDPPKADADQEAKKADKAERDGKDG